MRSLALRPAHSRRHLIVTRYTEGFSLVEVASAIALLNPGPRTGLLITKLQRSHLALAMAKMSSGGHFGDSEAGTAGDRQLMAEA